jgi:hypothetical protein
MAVLKARHRKLALFGGRGDPLKKLIFPPVDSLPSFSYRLEIVATDHRSLRKEPCNRVKCRFSAHGWRHFIQLDLFCNNRGYPSL